MSASSLLLMGFALAAAPSERLAEARAAERAGDPRGEREACEALLAEASESPQAIPCGRRLGWIAARAGEDGDLSALEELIAAREAPDGAARVRALASRPDLSPTLGAEVRAWLASDALERGDAAQGLAFAEEALALVPEQAAARRHRARALAELGRWEEAEAMEAAGAARSARPQEGVAILALVQRRERLGWLAWTCVLAFLLPALPLAARGWRPRPRPRAMGLVPLSAAVLGGAGLAAGWDLDASVALLASWPSLVALHLLAAGAGLALGSGPSRAALGLSAALASLGASFLTFRAFGALSGVGL